MVLVAFLASVEGWHAFLFCIIRTSYVRGWISFNWKRYFSSRPYNTSHMYVAGSPSTGDKESTQLTPAVLQGMHRYMGFFVTVTVVNSSIAEQLYSRIPC
jgi:hypothetical protein